MFIAILACCTAIGASCALTPIVRRAAHRYDFLDHPDAGRKTQARAVAFGGGIAILLAMWLGTAAAVIYQPQLVSLRYPPPVLLLLATVVIVGVGIWDDRHAMRGRHKLFLQVVVASIALWSGLSIQTIDFCGVSIDLGIFGSLFVIVWILGAMNAFNLIDGVDGLATIIGIAMSLGLGTIALIKGDPGDAAITLALCGALVGFLPYNKSPASIYLGDAGSMLIGLVLGFVALRCSLKEATTVAAAPLLGVWAILIWDSFAAVTRRVLTGKSIYIGDRGHIHHRFLLGGFSPGQTMLAIGGLCALTTGAAVLSIISDNELWGLAMAAAVIAGLAACRMFGHVECRLIAEKSWHLVNRPLQMYAPKTTSSRVQLQGNLKWNDLWTAVEETAERFGLLKVTVNVSIARLHEEHFGTWKSDKKWKEESTWYVERPFLIDSTVVGRFTATGRHDKKTNSAEMIDVLEFADEIADQIAKAVVAASRSAAEQGAVLEAPDSATRNPVIAGG